MTGNVQVDVQILRDLLDYDHSTGVFTWKHRVPSQFTDGEKSAFSAQAKCNRFNSYRAGSVALGAVDGWGHKHGIIAGKYVRTSRVVWAFCTGTWPIGVIDHINGIRTDDRFCNLRDVSSAENCRNIKIPLTHKTGAFGVRPTQSGKWKAIGNIGYKRVTIGIFDDEFSARVARKDFERENGFHPLHGASL